MANSAWYVQKNCEKCGDSFRAKRRKKWGEAARFCSRECWHKAKGYGPVTLVCQNCQKHYKISKRYIHPERQGPRRFCSHPCKLEYWRMHGKPQKNRAPHRNSGGYIYVYCPEHPSVQGKNYKRVAEHRLVMEEILGRNLKPNETVHHKNGIRDDNRPENLELWVKSHPAGQVNDYLNEIVALRIENEKLRKEL